MNSRLLVLFSIFILALGCSKDNNSANPTLKIKSYTSEVQAGGAFNAVLTYSQNGGTLSQDSMVVYRHWYNLALPPGVDIIDTFLTFLPETPNTGAADISVSLLYENLFVDFGENDTIDLRFVLIDQKGRHSDTAITGKIVLIK